MVVNLLRVVHAVNFNNKNTDKPAQKRPCQYLIIIPNIM